MKQILVWLAGVLVRVSADVNRVVWALAGFFVVAMLAAIRASAVVIFILTILYWSPAIVGHHMMRLTESMNITSAYVFLVVPLFAAIILIHLLARVFDSISAGWRTPKG